MYNRFPTFRALGNRHFAFLWTGQSFSRLGDHLYSIALAWWVLQETGSAAQMATILIFAFTPMLIFSLPGGVLADRYSRLRIMLAADLLRGMTAAVVAILALAGLLEVWHVYLLSLVFGLVEAFFQPAYMATIPQVTPTSDLPSANALTSFSVQGARIVGPPLGAAIIAFGGISLVFALNAATFILAAICLLPLLNGKLEAASQIQPANPAIDSRPADQQSPLTDLKEGIQMVLNAPWLWLTIGLFALVNVLLAGPYSISLPFLVNDELAGGPGTLGLLYAFFAAGYVLGGFWIGRSSQLRQRGRLIYGGVGLAGLMLALFGLPLAGLPLTIALLALAAVINGAALEAGALTWTQALQEWTPTEKLGRLSGIDALGSFALLPIGYALAGWATELLGPQTVFAIGGCATALVAFLAYRHPAIQAMNRPAQNPQNPVSMVQS